MINNKRRLFKFDPKSLTLQFLLFHTLLKDACAKILFNNLILVKIVGEKLMEIFKKKYILNDFESRTVLSLNWLPATVTEPNLSLYLNHSWVEKRLIYTISKGILN